MGNIYSNSFPPTPTLTEKNLADQTGKVFVVTGASSGIGEQLASILYQHNAKIYVAARSEEKATRAISDIKAKHPGSKGTLVYLHLDLNDLTKIKASADAFLAQETRLDVLWLNAGVMIPPQGSKTAQGWELQLGTNNLAHFLLIRLLHPILVSTASTAPANSVRVVWVASSATEMAPTPAIDFDNMNYEKDEGRWQKYTRSKAGLFLLGAEYARHVKNNGILSLILNPGNLETPLQRHGPQWIMWLARWLLHDPIYGAYTEIFAGLSPVITEKENGAWIQPWGRLVPVRKDLQDQALQEKYWNWTDEQVKEYM